MTEQATLGPVAQGRKGLDTDEVRRRLRLRHEWPDWLFFEEVPFEGPDGRTRLADAVALPTYQSRGYIVHGYEIKVTRSDWLRELQDMSKAEAIAKDVDRFWLVLGDNGIATDDEVPSTWGILGPGTDDKLRIRRQAKQLRAEDAPMPRKFLVTLARKAQKHADDRSAKDRDEAYERGMAAGRERAKYDQQGAPMKAEAYDRLCDQLVKYRSNGTLDKNQEAEIVEAVKVGRLVLGDRYDGLSRLPGLLEDAAKRVNDALRDNARRVRVAIAIKQGNGPTCTEIRHDGKTCRQTYPDSKKFADSWCQACKEAST